MTTTFPSIGLFPEKEENFALILSHLGFYIPPVEEVRRQVVLWHQAQIQPNMQIQIRSPVLPHSLSIPPLSRHPAIKLNFFLGRFLVVTWLVIKYPCHRAGAGQQVTVVLLSLVSTGKPQMNLTSLDLVLTMRPVFRHSWIHGYCSFSLGSRRLGLRNQILDWETLLIFHSPLYLQSGALFRLEFQTHPNQKKPIEASLLHSCWEQPRLHPRGMSR